MHKEQNKLVRILMRIDLLRLHITLFYMKAWYHTLYI
jgi:hypothetical protein